MQNFEILTNFHKGARLDSALLRCAFSSVDPDAFFAVELTQGGQSVATVAEYHFIREPTGGERMERTEEPGTFKDFKIPTIFCYQLIFFSEL